MFDLYVISIEYVSKYIECYLLNQIKYNTIQQIINFSNTKNLIQKMRLDASYLHFITKQQLRILVAIEIGMKNHEYVPLQLISSIGNLRSGQTYKTIKKLLKNKLVVHVGKKNNGYKLTYLGYDYLALNTFMKRNIVKQVVCKIGVGKQSDIYKCLSPQGVQIVLKLTRLGRRSFKTIKNNREYIQNRTNYNWLYLSRLSSIREFAFMQILNQAGFPTPRPIDTNRHAIVMSLIHGDPLCNIKKIGQTCSVKQIFLSTLSLAKKFAQNGLIHSDLNQFNLLISQSGQLTVIDFPQCISTNHPNAQQYFNRDIQCLYVFFNKMMGKCMRQNQEGVSTLHENDKGFQVGDVFMPVLKDVKAVRRLDLEVRAKGHFKLDQEKDMGELMKYWSTSQGVIETRKDNEQEQQQQQEQYIQDQQGQQINLQQQLKNIGQAEKQQIYNHESLNDVQKFDQNDEDIKQLMNELKQIQINTSPQPIKAQKANQNAQKQQQQVRKQGTRQNKNNDGYQSQQQEQQQQQQEQYQQGQIKFRQQWKGLTNYQIRQILKQQRKKQREKKKQQMSTQEYIKKALNRKKADARTPISKGNYGAKAKNKVKSQSIKDGMELGW